MKRNVLSVLLMIISPVVWAVSEVTHVDLGNQTLLVSQPLNSVFGQKTVTIPALCPDNCGDVTVEWTAMAPLLADIPSAPGTWLFDSGVKGIAIQISTKIPGAQPSAGESVSFQVGLVRVRQEVTSGTALLSKPLLKWSLLSRKRTGEQPVIEKEGSIVVGGNLAIGSCVLQSNSLTLNLKPVSVNEIKKVKPGELVTTGHSDPSKPESIIGVECTPGVFSSLSANFMATTTLNKTVIKTNEGTGVGFIVQGGGEGTNKSTINWNGEPLILNVPANGQLSYPLTAFYTPTSDIVKAGDITAQASFTISYP
ncbi:type 1 fimbrial protein [Salmonella enterica subsp. enterica serovar Java]|uniref:Type 1 fimbrial protein n=1 Tax=Salmonella enterica TaxID=28901 RepID=A0A743Z397_SALER|nr:type 1 fimbrial protein [Salmonella enterica subsp. enterica serovar Oranienburg]EBV8363748.1 type 1 fimbrial protein [Salmonella enterica subsp. enterica serovar Java]EBV8393107.1 type 1 fimbrial protein [Salmonella enterica subsp. enterica serovar Virchow]EDV5629309.1 type 1 fimbrial protein [Salmonella enterica subsp. enterica]EFU9023146.1 type 1 fimbrial protein [Salmonella enterica]